MKHENKNKIGLIVLLVAIVLFAGALTYAFFSINTTGEEEKLTVTTGTLALTFSDNNTGITASTLNIGESTTKEFIIENTGTLDVTTNMLWNNLINTYLKESLSYTFQYKTTEAGEWETTPLASGNIPRSATGNDYNLATDITIPAGTTYYYKLTITFNSLDNIDQTQDASAMLRSNFKLGDTVTLSDVDKTLLALGKFKNTGTPNFYNLATTDETSSGLYSMADDYGTSYYYRGAVEDNYVKFAGYYWRIIRVNGDGSLRMIYDGTQAYANGTANEDRLALTNTAWNANYSDAKYVGWMFGGADGTASTSYDGATTNETDSDIKEKVDAWYVSNLSSYSTYIADAIYCNDRSIPGSSVTLWTSDTELGYAKNATGYGAMGRLVDASSSTWVPKSSPAPQFTCPQQNDAFTVDDTEKGNGDLTYPIGFITADEIAVAGGRFYLSDGTSNNTSYYLYKGTLYWSLSPLNMRTNGYASVFDVNTNGNLNLNNVSNSGAVAPVISLKAEYASQLEGSGTTSSPFEIPGVA